MQRLVQIIREIILRKSNGFSALMVARLLILSYNFAVSLAIFWKFGVAATGTYALAQFPSTAAALVAAMGLPNALPRQQLSNGERATIGLMASIIVLMPVTVACAGYGMAIGNTTAEAAAIALFAVGGGLCQLGTQQMLLVLQRKTAWAPLSPIVNLVGLGIAVLAPTLTGFALLLTAGRLLGCLLGFAPLSFAWTSPRRALRVMIEGLRFTGLDLVLMASELAPVPLLVLFLSRSEIGVFGLARQFVTAADTPGWSFVQAQYPALVADVAIVGELARRSLAIACAAVAAVLPLALLLALLIYHLPLLAATLPAVLLPLPLRYMAHLCDQTLRATGRIRDCTLLGLGKLILSCVLFATMADLFGFWGVVGAFMTLSGSAGIVYSWWLAATYPAVRWPQVLSPT
jgi:O-antigen/teichoic acid export membrane protein